MDEEEEEEESDGSPDVRDADAYDADAWSDLTGATFNGPASITVGKDNVQINNFGVHPEKDHERQLTEYLAAAALASREHPYPVVLPGSGPALDDVYVPQRLGNLVQDGLPQEAGALGRILAAKQTCVVLAGAGGGKSSLLRTVLATGVNRRLHAADPGPVPVLVPAAALEDRSLSKALALAAQLQLRGLVRTLSPDLFQHPPRPGASWLVLVDELDEIADPVRRRKVLSGIHQIDENQNRPATRERRTRSEPLYRFVIATRPLPEGELEVLGPEVARFELERFQPTDVEHVAHRWFDAHGLRDPARQAHLFAADLNRSRLAGIARIPLTASLLCQLRAAAPEAPLPKVRGEIYAEFAGLLHRRQYHPAEPGNPRELPAGFARYGEAAVARAEHTLSRLPDLVDHLAHERLRGNRLDAVEIVRSHPDAAEPPYPVPSGVWREFLSTALNHSGFLTFHAGDHDFTHQTLMEYCAARRTAHTLKARTLRRITARWRDAEPSYVGFVIDAASPEVRRRAMSRLHRLARRGRLEACLFLAELARLGTGLAVHVVDAVARRLAESAQNERLDESSRTRAVVALTGLPDPGVRTILRDLVQSGALSGTPLVAGIEELRELGDPHVPDVLHDLALSEAQSSRLRLWATGHLAAARDPRLPGVLYALTLSTGVEGPGRYYAAEQLKTLRDPRAREAWHAIATCPSAGASIRFASAFMLEALHDDRLPDVLCALAGDRGADSSVRQLAARRACASGDARTAELLLRLVQDPELEPDFRRWAADELAARNHPGLPDVLHALALDPSLGGPTRVRAAWHLARTGDPQGRELLRAFALTKPSGHVSDSFQDDDLPTRAASALAALGGPDAPDVLRVLARDGSRSALVRRSSVRQLADLGDSRAADALHTLALDTGLPAYIRTEAAFELIDLHDPRATGLLRSLVLDTALTPNEQAFVLVQLCTHVDERVPGILRDLVLREPLDPVCRSRAVAGLAARPEAGVPDLLFSVAAHTGAAESVRSTAAKALAARDDVRAPEQLRALAADPALRPGTRDAAITWLGRSALPRAQVLLCELAASAELDSGLRYSAARTLARHHAPEAPGLLVALALDGSALPRDRAAAAHHLTDRGNPRGPDLLCALAKDRSVDDEHRFEAAEDLTDLHDARGPDLFHDLALDAGLRPFTRSSAVRKLGRHQDPRLPELLRTLAADATLDGATRLALVRRLARSGDPAGRELLRHFAGDPGLDPALRSQAVKELDRPSPPAERPGRRALDHGQAGERNRGLPGGP